MDRPQPNLNQQIYEEASTWFVECRGGDLDDVGRRAFDEWLRKSPEHLGAYLEIAAIWNEGPVLDPQQKWDLDTLIAQAAQDPESNVIQLCAGASEPATARAAAAPPPLLAPTAAKARKTARPYAIAASLLAISCAGGTWLYGQRNVYSTSTGEQRSLAFADGSTIELNSRSKVRVRYTKTEREVELLEGQALFHVAKDSVRPFIVDASHTHVRAVGTQFDVYRRRAGLVVTVVEGRVAVTSPERGTTTAGAQPMEGAGTAASPDAPPANRRNELHELLLSAGEQLTINTDVPKKADHPNIAAATAWTQRRIVFDSASLAEVAEEFNRYNDRQIVIDAPKPADFHISGVFSSTDPNSLIHFLRSRPDVRVTEDGAAIRIAGNISQ